MPMTTDMLAEFASEEENKEKEESNGK